jgi:uncharacterized RDD family membrane protein YckC
MTANDDDRPTTRAWACGIAVVVIPVVVVVLVIAVVFLAGGVNTGLAGPVGTLKP